MNPFKSKIISSRAPHHWTAFHPTAACVVQHPGSQANDTKQSYTWPLKEEDCPFFQRPHCAIIPRVFCAHVQHHHTSEKVLLLRYHGLSNLQVRNWVIKKNGVTFLISTFYMALESITLQMPDARAPAPCPGNNATFLCSHTPFPNLRETVEIVNTLTAAGFYFRYSDFFFFLTLPLADSNTFECSN